MLAAHGQPRGSWVRPPLLKRPTCPPTRACGLLHLHLQACWYISLLPLLNQIEKCLELESEFADPECL